MKISDNNLCKKSAVLTKLVVNSLKQQTLRKQPCIIRKYIAHIKGENQRIE